MKGEDFGLDDAQIAVIAAAYMAAREGTGIPVQPDSLEAAEKLERRGWLRRDGDLWWWTREGEASMDTIESLLSLEDREN